MLKSIFKSAALIATLAGSAQAADMPLKARPVPVPVYTWTGFYGGINGGYAWSGDQTIAITPGDPFIQFATCGGGAGGTCAQPTSSRLKGGFGGLQTGYNWQVNPFLLAGLEADLQGSAIRGNATNAPFRFIGLPSQITTEDNVKWFGTVRGRLGFLPTDRLLIYGTGGFAFGRVEANSMLTILVPVGSFATGGFGFGANCIVGVSLPNCFAGNSTRTASGWTAGGGFEFALSPSISLKAEYLYVNLGTDNHSLVASVPPPPPAAPASFIVSRKLDYNLVRIGLNYRFDPPVVAKY